MWKSEINFGCHPPPSSLFETGSAITCHWVFQTGCLPGFPESLASSSILL